MEVDSSFDSQSTDYSSSSVQNVFQLGPHTSTSSFSSKKNVKFESDQPLSVDGPAQEEECENIEADAMSMEQQNTYNGDCIGTHVGKSCTKKKLSKLNRKSRISPIRKDLLKAQLLKDCLNRTKKNRDTLISRIRLGEVTSAELAREILNEQVAIQITDDDRAEHVFEGGGSCAQDITLYDSFASYNRSSSILDDDATNDLDDERYQQLMSEIYESICNEINEELNSEYAENFGVEDNFDWGQLVEDEFLDVPAEALLLCPFCKIQCMEPDFEMCVCRCNCGMSFSFTSRSHELLCVGDLRDLLSSVYDKHNIICSAVANINPASTLDFQLSETKENMHAYCCECGFFETIL